MNLWRHENPEKLEQQRAERQAQREKIQKDRIAAYVKKVVAQAPPLTKKEEPPMRWLTQYPVTADEIMQALQSIPQTNPPGTPPNQQRIGGIQDHVRQSIIQYFQNDTHMNDLLTQIQARS